LGITGTNGKSTVVELCAAILDAAGLLGRIGTLGQHLVATTCRAAGDGSHHARGFDLFRLLASMRDRGARAVAMEVSSHALVQGRVQGARFDIALFTNLTRDHLDFHGDLETYFAAKRRLFDALKPGGLGVANLDDPYGRRLADELGLVHTFGSSGSGAAVRSAGVDLDSDGIRGALVTPRGQVRFRSPLLGRFNLANLLAAAAAAEALGLPFDAVMRGIEATRPLAGRLEAVRAGQAFLAIVDFAHTDAALEAAIRALRELTGTKVVVVFGCGGEKDQGKRPLMGKVAGDLADLPIATSDNPRSEDPLAILAAVEEGLKASTNRNYRSPRSPGGDPARECGGDGRRLVRAASPARARERQIVGNQRLPFSDARARARSPSSAPPRGRLECSTTCSIRSHEVRAVQRLPLHHLPHRDAW
jgi:UDP-N-acetylmuramoyl-L-alanyl-D-glutamate--2,6-diaminopimelate ligase